MRGCGVILLIWCAGLTACQPLSPPPPVSGQPKPDREVFRAAARRFAAVVVADEQGVVDATNERWMRRPASMEVEGGSAVPIAADGYFLTADHVLARAGGKRVSILLRREGRIQAFPARIVWRIRGGDLALLHAAVETKEYYRWTPGDRWLPRGTPVMHAGIATGFASSSGKLLTALAPDASLGGTQRFKHDIPLEPGDSGGPVVDANGRLVGINSAVEYLIPLETAFFMESEANRPNLVKLQSRIERDRASRSPR
jgi:S1-C subfamily serine protease